MGPSNNLIQVSDIEQIINKVVFYQKPSNLLANKVVNGWVTNFIQKIANQGIKDLPSDKYKKMNLSVAQYIYTYLKFWQVCDLSNSIKQGLVNNINELLIN